MSEEIKTKYGFITTKKRSKIMSNIGSKDTKPEIRLRKTLWHLGIRYRVDYSELPGKPDIAITKNNIGVFVDGEFWHGYNWEEKKKNISTNRDYWIPKIEGNMKRDREVNKKLKNMGWTVLRYWEQEVKNDLDACVSEILNQVNQKSDSS